MKFSRYLTVVCTLLLSQFSLCGEHFSEQYMYQITNPSTDQLNKVLITTIDSTKIGIRANFNVDELNTICKSLPETEKSRTIVTNIQDICKSADKVYDLTQKIKVVSNDESDRNQILYQIGLSVTELDMLKQIRYSSNGQFYWAANIFIDRSQRILNPFVDPNNDDKIIRHTAGFGIQSSSLPGASWEFLFIKKSNDNTTNRADSLLPDGVMILRLEKF